MNKRRRLFFTKLGGFLGVILLPRLAELSSNSKSDKKYPQKSSSENTYTFTKLRPANLVLSEESLSNLDSLRDRFRAENKLLSISSITLGRDLDGKIKLQITKTFDSKESRDEYVQQFEALVPQVKNKKIVT